MKKHVLLVTSILVLWFVGITVVSAQEGQEPAAAATGQDAGSDDLNQASSSEFTQDEPLLYDDFDSYSHSESLWETVYNTPNWEINDGVLTLYSEEYQLNDTISKQGFSQDAISYESKTKFGGDCLEFGECIIGFANGQGEIEEYFRLGFESPAQLSACTAYNWPNNDCQVITEIDAGLWHVYRIDISQSMAKFYIDETFVFEAPTDRKERHALQAAWADFGGYVYVDYARVDDITETVPPLSAEVYVPAVMGPLR